MKHPPAIAPDIINFDEFLHSLKLWWVSLQPEGRGGELSRQLPKTLKSWDWGKLSVGGPYGMFSFVVSLRWCVEARGASTEFRELLNDIMWTLKELVKDSDEEASTSRRRSGRTSVATPSSAPRGTKRPAEPTTTTKGKCTKK